MKKFYSLIGVLVFWVGIGILTAIVTGFALATLWGWFIHPLGVPNISIAQGLGIAVLVGMFKTTDYAKKDDVGSRIKASVAILAPLFSLLVGAIIHIFM